jgi:hypothetical protein
MKSGRNARDRSGVACCAGLRKRSEIGKRRLTMGDLFKRGGARGLLAIVLAWGAPISAQALDVGPKSLPLTVAGVAVQIPVAGSIDVHSDADAITLKVNATGDLKSIQDRALAIARGLKLPRDPCAHKNVNLVVNSIDAASITPHGASATVDLSGHVTVWLCKKILGAVLKTELASDSVSISAPVELYVATPQSIALRLTGPVNLKTSDPAITDAASSFVGDVNAALSMQLAKLLDAARARAAVPPMAGLEVTIESAAFAQDGPKLIVRASGRATMTSAGFATFLGFIGG